MKKILTLLIIPLLLLAFYACESTTSKKRTTEDIVAAKAKNPNYDYEVFVIGIADGDTFTGLTHAEKIKIRYRLHGVDAPEKAQPFSKKSKQLLSDLIFNKTVGIKVETKRDKYGRPIVRVFTPDGKDVGAELLKNGLAWHYKQYDDSETYAKLEKEAQNARIGLWSDKSSIEPWEYRRGKR